MLTMMAAVIALFFSIPVTAEVLAVWDAYSRRQHLRRWLAERGLRV
jgi:hypothetical protein